MIPAAAGLFLVLLNCGFAATAGAQVETGQPATDARAAIADIVPERILAELRPGLSLENALATLARAGYPLSYSSAVVKPDMTLHVAPKARGLADLLAELLTPWNLSVTREDDGVWVIKPAARTAARTAASDDPTRPENTAANIEDVPLGEIDVTASRYGLADVAASNGTFLTREEVRALPHLTDDAVRMLHVLPGVAGGDISAQLNIRGGRRDEVLLRLDGVEIRDPFHIREVGGAISLVDTNIVESMTFVTGGMTVDAGNAMSGVIDIETIRLESDEDRQHALGVSFINAFLRSQGTFGDGRGQWLASARRGYLDLVMRRIQDDDEEFTPRYQDAFARVTYDFGSRTSLGAHALLGTEELTFLMEDGSQQSGGDSETGTVWVTLDHQWSDALRMTTILSSGKTDRQRGALDDRPDDYVATLRDRAEFDFTQLRQDWAWQPHSDHSIRWGLQGARENGDYVYLRQSAITDPVLAPDGPIDTSQNVVAERQLDTLGLYAAYRTRIFESLVAELGWRSDRYRYAEGASYTRNSPRINLVFSPDAGTELRAAWAVIHQPQSTYELQVEDGLSGFFAPERVEHVTLGFQQRLGSFASLRVDGYRKRYSALRPLFENLFDGYDLMPEAAPDRTRVDASRARVHGVETTLRATAGTHWSGWLGYSWSRAEDYDGSWRPRFWDQRHAATMSLQWQGAKWRASLAGIYHTGWPTTSLSARTVVLPDGTTRIEPVLGARNDRRLGSFVRVDLRASREVRLSGGTLTWYLEVFNLLNRDNPCCVDDFELLPNADGSFATRANYDYWLPLLPSFGVQYEF